MQSELLYAWIDQSQHILKVSQGWADFVGAPEESEGANLAHVLPERLHSVIAFECVKAQAQPLQPQSFIAQIEGQNHLCEVVWVPTVALYTLVIRTSAHNVADLPRDELTNLPGRELLSVRIADELKRDAAPAFAIIMIDLDRFGWINDTLGDAVGDMALKEVAQRLTKLARGRDLAVRLEGDRFALLVTGLDNDEAGIDALHHLIEVLEKGIYIEQRELFITVSAGIAMSPTHGTRVESLMLHADKAMYDAKTKGEGQYSVYDDTMAKGAQPTLMTISEIESAFESRALELRFRPSHNLKNHTIEGAEPMVCWQHPNLGLIHLADCQEMVPSALLEKFARWQISEVVRLCKESPEFAELSYILIDTQDLLLTSEQGLDPWVKAFQQNPQGLHNLLFVLCDEDADLYARDVKKLVQAGANIAISVSANFDLPLSLVKALNPSYLFLDESLYDLNDRELSRHSPLEAVLSYARQGGVPVGALQTQSAQQMSRLYNHGHQIMAGPYFGAFLTLAQLLQLIKSPMA